MDLNFALVIFCLTMITLVAMFLNKDHIAKQAINALAEQWRVVLQLLKRKG
jgi:predicted PurR-regulated permease PerM